MKYLKTPKPHRARVHLRLPKELLDRVNAYFNATKLSQNGKLVMAIERGLGVEHGKIKK